MHNVVLIARREYLERVRTKGFLLATVLIPLLMGSMILVMVLVTASKTESHVAVVTTDATFAADVKEQLRTGQNRMQVDTYGPADGLRETLDAQLHAKKSTLAGYLWVTPPAHPGDRPAMAYAARSAGDVATQNALADATHTALMREGLIAHGVTPAEIDAMSIPTHFDTSASGNAGSAFLAAYLLCFLMYIVIMLYGMNTARSIIDEKTSRIFEVLLATIKPNELLAGKILGVGAVGLTQIGVWMIAAFAFANSGFVPATARQGHPLVSGAQIGFFVLYFLFGFLIYSSVAAAMGAMTNSEQELQQLNLFLVIPLFFCMLMIVPIVHAPDSTMARALSLVPFFSPMLMNLRVAITRVPAWEIWLSIALMTATIAAILSFSARIYRVGILMYGKKPNLPEIMRWMKYS